MYFNCPHIFYLLILIIFINEIFLNIFKTVNAIFNILNICKYTKFLNNFKCLLLYSFLILSFFYIYILRYS